MNAEWKNSLITARAFTHVPGYFAKGRWRFAARPVPAMEFHVPALFFGVCAASSMDPACDDFIVARLKELGIRCVRIDVTTVRASFRERFLKRLIEEQFRICLHLVQPREEVREMTDPKAQSRWRSFVAGMLDTYGAQADLVEIGSTCNRRKWSGYTVSSYLLSWRIAWEEAHRRNMVLAGPNVTDFEPVYNIALLAEMKRLGMVPATQTNNLFVERAVEPEAFDHKILGRWMAGTIRFNLVRKAQLLNDIADWAGVSGTVCTQVSWSLRRIARLTDDLEEKQADYVTRYCCLAAASGALSRVYWGPLIGQREGLIDDGTTEFPDIPHVTFYGQANGSVSNYRQRPAFRAFQTVNQFIAGTVFKRKLPSGRDLEILEFSAPDKIIHVVWTTDGHCAVVSDCYDPDMLGRARVFSREGVPVAKAPSFFSESPVYMVWPSGTRITLRGIPAVIRGVCFANIPGRPFALIDHAPWKGVTLAEDSGIPIDITTLMEIANCKLQIADCRFNVNVSDHPPSTIHHQPSLTMLRDSRNCVWAMPAPWNSSRTIIVKQFKPRHVIRRLLQYGKPDRAQRSWNGAQELLRRGINTPLPTAFFHHSERASACDCYYICEAFTRSKDRPEDGAQAWSVRQAFTAFSKGDVQFQRKPDSELYDAIAHFLVKMHERGVFFRDLSAGNLLFRSVPDSDRTGRGTEIEFALIDTARARFYPESLILRKRLYDLMRLCHPLHWCGREMFVGKYMALAGRSFRLWMKIPFIYYDLKHWSKNAVKKLRFFHVGFKVDNK